MTELQKRATIEIDAKGKVFGRLASRVAFLLQGKNSPSYVPNKDVGNFVTILNAASLKITGAKLEQREYYRHTGYPGGLRTERLKILMRDDASRALRYTVATMLPRTKHRQKWLKRLTIRNYGNE